MLIEAIGAVLPAALAVGLSPFPVVGVVLLLAGRHGRRNGPLFAAGWVAGLAPTPSRARSPSSRPTSRISHLFVPVARALASRSVAGSGTREAPQWASAA
ncbi:hypothetical protein ACFY8C_34655 [Streptomyces flavochromogenes]|uniref:Uncharacterized protein n=1 Tax=Streptomyces flavochromogenes TaxID=68199 RepID=A0ABW6Y1C7_9ACTN|nr:hypothetical protein [Streptomyces flavochromogenes]